MSIVKKLRHILFDLSVESKGISYRLTVAFGLFFLAPLLGFFYFAFKYDLLQDEYVPLFFLGFLASCLFGYVILRRIFDRIGGVSQQIAQSLSQDLPGLPHAASADELGNVLRSFQIMERELRSHFGMLDRKINQIGTLKELSDLCYVTFDTEDLLHITLERALKLSRADIGSVLILERPARTRFVVQATIGLGGALKKGDAIDFGDSIAKYAVINKSPLLIDNIETDSRFGRQNRPQYGTKGFLCMPLKGINEVLGVLTLSRRTDDAPFTADDVEILTPLLSNAAFTYDNLQLAHKNNKRKQLLQTLAGLCKTVNSSLRNAELLHTVLGQIQAVFPFDGALILTRDAEASDRLLLTGLLSSHALELAPERAFPYAGSLFDQAIREDQSLLVEDTGVRAHPTERLLFSALGLASAMIAPLKADGRPRGVVVFGARSPASLRQSRGHLDGIAALLSLAVEKDRLTRSVAKRDREMQSLKQIGGILASSTFDLDKVMEHTLAMIQALMDVKAGSLFLVQDRELEFKVAFNLDVDVEPLLHRRIPLGQGIAGYCAARGEALLVRDVAESPQFQPDIDQTTGFQTRSVLCVPLISQGRVLGVIEVLNKRQGEFNDNDLHLLQSIAASVGIAIENARLYGETRAMAEQERSVRSVFQKFVPREIVDKILHGMTDELPVMDELKILTLLNIDLRGFSSVTKRLGPQKTVAVLNDFFGCMGDIVFRYNGIVDKYLGDGFLALFGAPVSSVNDADNAIAAALAMREAFASFGARVAAETRQPIAMGIALHTGEVVAGNIGFEKKMDYTVIGDAVNVAFRIQDLTRSHPNGILVSEKTLRSVLGSLPRVQEIGRYDAGDVLGELKIYEIVGPAG